MPLQPGGRLGPYEVIGPIGAGGMGEVYRARDPRIAREVAIKILPSEYAAHPDRLARFSQEARTTAALNHPNLLTIFDIGTHEETPFLVTELLEGETLRERLDRGAVSSRRAIEWAIQIAEGVAAAHEKGIVHRDIKPDNVFITRDERIKLLDFGLAKLVALESSGNTMSDDVETRMRQTQPGSVLGTPGYMAPEQVRGEPVDERADIFACGILLAEMLTGSNPFRRATTVETMTAILQSDAVLPDSVAPALARVIEHMLAKPILARFQSMRDVAFSLQLLSSGSQISGEKLPAVGRAGSSNRPPERNFLGLTLRRGRIGGARFTRDGTVAFGAAWEGNPLEIFLATPGKLESIPIGAAGADLLSVSPTGDYAVSLERRFLGGWVSIGTLARMRNAGGAPRKLLERVVDADWSPDGKSIAIIRQSENGSFVLEHPIGRPLRVSGGWLSHVRFSPDGKLIAFIDHHWFGDDAGRPVVIDLDGREVLEPSVTWASTSGLAWSPDGEEVWFAGERLNMGRNIVGIHLSGAERLVLSSPGQLTLCDVRADGAMLVMHDNWRREVYTAPHGEAAQKNLAWYDWPMIGALSADGTELLIEEQRARSSGGSDLSALFLRPVDGGPAVHIADGRGRAMSPDGNWIAADTGIPGHLEIIPTGLGESKLVKVDFMAQSNWWQFFPDGKRLLISGTAPDQSRLSVAVPIDGGEPVPAGPGNLGWPFALSPDGERVVAAGPDEQLMIYPVAGGDGAVLRGAERGEWPICWSDDAKYLYVYPRGRMNLTIDRIDVATGERVVWQEIRPGDPAGIVDIWPVWLTPDGGRYAYSYRRCLSDLYLVTNS